MRIRAIWKRAFGDRYTELLEREVGRLRAENRALLNSILGIAGVPPLPIEVPPEEVESEKFVGGIRRADVRSGGNRESSNGHASSPQPVSGHSVNGQGALPLRRRSWQQINRMLEIESARKKAEV
jgi:hypothetical protein